jgi:hypothetical protein
MKELLRQFNQFLSFENTLIQIDPLPNCSLSKLVV